MDNPAWGGTSFPDMQTTKKLTTQDLPWHLRKFCEEFEAEYSWSLPQCSLVDLVPGILGWIPLITSSTRRLHDLMGRNFQYVSLRRKWRYFTFEVQFTEPLDYELKAKFYRLKYAYEDISLSPVCYVCGLYTRQSRELLLHINPSERVGFPYSFVSFLSLRACRLCDRPLGLVERAASLSAHDMYGITRQYSSAGCFEHDLDILLAPACPSCGTERSRELGYALDRKLVPKVELEGKVMPVCVLGRRESMDYVQGYQGGAPLVQVLKCRDCGHSVYF